MNIEKGKESTLEGYENKARKVKVRKSQRLKSGGAGELGKKSEMLQTIGDS